MSSKKPPEKTDAPKKKKEKKKKLLPLDSVIQDLIKRLQKKDIYSVFRELVDRNEVPTYYDVIKQPMAFSVMNQKIQNKEYTHIDQFKADFDLMISNCLFFNAEGSVWCKEALKLQRYGNQIISTAAKSVQPDEDDEEEESDSEEPAPLPHKGRKGTPSQTQSPPMTSQAAPAPHFYHQPMPSNQPSIESRHSTPPSPAPSSQLHPSMVNTPNSMQSFMPSNPHSMMDQNMGNPAHSIPPPPEGEVRQKRKYVKSGRFKRANREAGVVWPTSTLSNMDSWLNWQKDHERRLTNAALSHGHTLNGPFFHEQFGLSSSFVSMMSSSTSSSSSSSPLRISIQSFYDTSLTKFMQNVPGLSDFMQQKLRSHDITS
eukprot:TRINITY_DN6448_c0_g1_i1.p1 TRINITY_DN6448_c0_g1~~TRINITY_DN6448_c0_g1_i1.p1  ORF type:complete len:371 (-),score=93.86 TRINITY_DN6448_c0_g1_i1:90-1202(-)